MTTSVTTPIVKNVKRHRGIAGQFQITAEVTYPGEKTMLTSFVGTAFGSPGPVVMVWGPSQEQTVVADPERFGESFNEDWVRRFYGFVDRLAR